MERSSCSHCEPRGRHRALHDAGLLGEVKMGEELPFTTDILRTLNPMLKQGYTDPAMVRHFSSALGEAINLAVSRGVQQGDVLGSVLWCLAMHPVLCRVMDRHERVQCVAFADNVWCIGKLSDVLPATKDLATAMETNLKSRSTWGRATSMLPLSSATRPCRSQPSCSK